MKGFEKMFEGLGIKVAYKTTHFPKNVLWNLKDKSECI